MTEQRIFPFWSTSELEILLNCRLTEVKKIINDKYLYKMTDFKISAICKDLSERYFPNRLEILDSSAIIEKEGISTFAEAIDGSQVYTMKYFFHVKYKGDQALFSFSSGYGTTQELRASISENSVTIEFCANAPQSLDETKSKLLSELNTHANCQGGKLNDLKEWFGRTIKDMLSRHQELIGFHNGDQDIISIGSTLPRIIEAKPLRERSVRITFDDGTTKKVGHLELPRFWH